MVKQRILTVALAVWLGGGMAGELLTHSVLAQTVPVEGPTTNPAPNSTNSEIPPPNPTEASPVDPSNSDITLPNPTEVLPTAPGGGVPSVKFPTLAGEPNQVIEQVETYQSQPYANYLGLKLYGQLTTADQISQILKNLSDKTNTRQALVYVLSSAKALKLVLILPEETVSTLPSSFRFGPHQGILSAAVRPILQAQQTLPPTAKRTFLTFDVPEANSKAVRQTLRNFRNQISDPTKNASDRYQKPAKQLYDWIVTPLKPTLDARGIDTLIFSLDRGLRTMPIAALYDGRQFLVEQYNLAIIPSFSLTDTRFQSLRESQMLGMGVTQSAGGLPPLPGVSVEVPILTKQLWKGEGYLDQQSTLEQFQTLARREQFSIIHLATHAEFNSGNPDQSFIQFWNGKLTLTALRRLALDQKWGSNPTLEMLVLSACKTALGNDQAELGFTGLAVQTGVKTAIGSLWAVSDAGTLGLMSEFYRNLRTAPIRAAALRKAQVSLLKGNVQIVDGKLQLSDGTLVTLPPEVVRNNTFKLSHPYFWAPFTLVGNWN